MAIPSAALVAMIFIVYGNTLSVPFILDDLSSIATNQTIRQLWPPTVIFPKYMEADTVGGRPLLNFTFAVNYALHGLDVWGYHLTNLMIHTLAATTLLLLVKGCLLTLEEDSPLRRSSNWLAFAVSSLWAAHPLNTQAVTYIVQRGESLASLFYLLVLYCLLRSESSGRRALWLTCGVVSCTAAMLTKEIAVTAPLTALLFDRAFLSGTFGKALKKRWPFHLALWATAALPFLLLASTGLHGDTTGMVSIAQSVKYLKTQIWVVADYLRLAVFPNRLIFHYGGAHHDGFLHLLPSGLLLAALALVALYVNVRNPRAGFPAAIFFIVLAPTSTIFPIIDPQFEHRMYLPLAGVVATAVTGIFALAWGTGKGLNNRRAVSPVLVVLLAITAIALGAATFARNALYRDEMALWEDVIEKLPDNGPAYAEKGRILLSRGMVGEAVEAYRSSLGLWPDYQPALGGLTKAYIETGDYQSALKTVERINAAAPGSLFGRYTKASILIDLNRAGEALVILRTLGIEYADDANVNSRIGTLLATRNMPAEALPFLDRAAALDPGHPGYRNNLGLALLNVGRSAEAVRHLQEAVRLDAGNEQTRRNLALARKSAGY